LSATTLRDSRRISSSSVSFVVIFVLFGAAGGSSTLVGVWVWVSGTAGSSAMVKDRSEEQRSSVVVVSPRLQATELDLRAIIPAIFLSLLGH
jgi:hypothetical protein